jgi:hypothetical protein
VTGDDLLKMLDLGGTEPSPTAAEPVIETTSPTTPPVPAGPTALELDAWALRRGRELLDESDRLKGLALDEYAVADFHACGFGAIRSL